MNYEVWTMNYKTRSLDFEVWTVKSEVWTLNCEVRSVNCEVGTVKSELWSLNNELWSVNYAVWSVNCEVWTVKSEVWSVKSELWSVKFEAWSLNCQLKRPRGRAVSAPDFRSRGLGFEYRWTRDSVLTLTALHCTELSMFTLPSSWYDWNTVELNVKPQIIHPWIVNFEMALSVVFYT